MGTSTIKYDMRPMANQNNVIQGTHYRITLLTDRLVRFEYNEQDIFTDLASQVVWFRDLGQVTYKLKRNENYLEIITNALVIRYDEKKYSSAGLQVRFLHPDPGAERDWYYGKEEKNLLGTARTLDEANGEIPLEKGIISLSGFAVLDDAHTVLLDETGWVQQRQQDGMDFYLFAYGHQYREAVKAFYRITGKVPMIPRYALGNWWSRYYKYTEETYKELIGRFEAEKVPFSVAVIDMDWHLVDIPEQYGSGWTGYTWNKEFFPNPAEFLEWLHEHNLRTTLNVHPALGIRGHEEMYSEVAKAMGIDPSTEEPVEFDFTNKKFIETYFNQVHHPQEEDGVDFWWLDWQQGSDTRIKGLDPLWLLNHYHYLDHGRDGKRPMCFSRYAGPGSHRYPVGFSGDTVVTWDSLEFQPYFTYTASNIGYGWWSHDIGGHMLGIKSDVMALRWLQFGVFSPINRLHSSNMEFCGKEPWKYPMEIHAVMNTFLRLRHQLIPYLYTMNYLAYKEGRPMLCPMYYDYPEEMNAYPFVRFMSGGYKNQYLFGTDFLVAPIVSDNIPSVNMGKVSVWLPKGCYHDFFTGMIYEGDSCMDLYRDVQSIPVLVKAGAIVPLHPEVCGENMTDNPTHLEIRVYAGADGNFVLYEDDNISRAYEKNICAKTRMSFQWEESRFLLEAAVGKKELLPEKRTYTISFMGVKENVPQVISEGKEVEVSVTYEKMKGMLTIEVPQISAEEPLTVTFKQPLELNDNHELERIHHILTFAQTDVIPKELTYQVLQKYQNVGKILREIKMTGLDTDVAAAIEEILTARIEK